MGPVSHVRAAILGLIVLACVGLPWGAGLLALLFCLGVAFGLSARRRGGPAGD